MTPYKTVPTTERGVSISSTRTGFRKTAQDTAKSASVSHCWSRGLRIKHYTPILYRWLNAILSYLQKSEKRVYCFPLILRIKAFYKLISYNPTICFEIRAIKFKCCCNSMISELFSNFQTHFSKKKRGSWWLRQYCTEPAISNLIYGAVLGPGLTRNLMPAHALIG